MTEGQHCPARESGRQPGRVDEDKTATDRTPGDSPGHD